MSDFDLAFIRLKRWRDGPQAIFRNEFDDDVKKLIDAYEKLVDNFEQYREISWRNSSW
jgi:hypothetical protein